MAKKPQPILEVDLQNNGGKFAFSDLAGISEWIETERTFWSWVSQFDENYKNSPEINTIFNAINNHLNQIEQQRSKAESHKDSDNFPNHLDRLKNLFIQNYLGRPRLIHSNTSEANFVTGLSQENKYRGAYALGSFMFVDLPTTTNSVKGMVDSYIFEIGLKGAEAEKEALADLKNNWDQHLVKYGKDQDSLQNDFENLKEKIETLHKGQQDHFKEQLDNFKKEYEILNNTYEEKLSLQAPVSYWTNKKKNHFKSSIIFGVVTVLIMVAIFLVLGWEVREILKEATEDQPPPYWQLSILIISGTLGIWIVRIFIRLLLSQIHLQIDAGEREIMTETYLALLGKGGGIQEKDRTIILQNLFRPTSTGIVKDEAMPPNLMDFINRLSGKK